MAKDVNDRMAIEIRGDKVIRATALFIEKINIRGSIYYIRGILFNEKI